MREKNLAYYLSLPYTIELTARKGHWNWFVSVKELPGCMSFGETTEETLEMIQDALKGWLEVALEDNMEIPEPEGD